MTAEVNERLANAVKEEREIRAKEQHLRDEITKHEEEIAKLRSIRFDKTRDYCRFYEYGACTFSGECSDRDPGDEWPYYKNACNLRKEAENVIYPGLFKIYGKHPSTKGDAR